MRDGLSAFSGSFGGGLGPALALGLTGAALAATPRAAELTDPHVATKQKALWRGVLLGGLVAVIAVQVLTLVALGYGLIDHSRLSLGLVLATLYALSALGFGSYLAIRVVQGATQGDDTWRSIAIAIGSATLVWHLVVESSLEDYTTFMATANMSTAYLALLPAIAAVLLCPVFAPDPATAGAPGRWITAASRASGFAATVAAGTVALLVLIIILTATNPSGVFSWGGSGIDGKLVTATLLLAITAAAALVARGSLVSDPATGRTTALVATGLIVALSFTTLLVVSDGLVGQGLPMDAWLLWLAIGLPGLVGYALLGPLPVRMFYGYVPPAAVAHAPETAHAAPAPPVAPVAPVPAAAPAAAHGFTAAQAADPATPAAVLAQIVEHAPELRAHVAANPSTYPALLDWLRGLGDPAIDAVLATRR